ncbi:flagellar M-ring protein [Escherichia coli]|nr:flagellar M-ring protein [Escherichia coli]
MPVRQNRAVLGPVSAGGRWFAGPLGGGLLWRKGVRPPLTRRAEAMKAVQQQAQAREEVEDAVEVRLSKDEQLQQRRANQGLGSEVIRQRTRARLDKDPPVVGLVIGQR